MKLLLSWLDPFSIATSVFGAAEHKSDCTKNKRQEQTKLKQYLVMWLMVPVKHRILKFPSETQIPGKKNINVNFDQSAQFEVRQVFIITSHCKFSAFYHLRNTDLK